MGMFSRDHAGQRVPSPALVDEAKANPGGWVYEIDRGMRAVLPVPPDKQCHHATGTFIRPAR